MKQRTANKLLKIAKKENNLTFYQVATGEIDMLAFLDEYIKANELGDLKVCGTTLAKVIKANNTRKKTLQKWLDNETNDAFRKFHEKQIAILDDYAEAQLIDIIETTEALKAQAKLDAK